MRLRKTEFRQYYNLRYVISTILRGGEKEFHISGAELDAARFHYAWFHRIMYTFMQRWNIGEYSRRGKLRIFWPVRFMMQEIFKAIGREDLVRFVPAIRTPERYRLYKKYWKKMQREYQYAEVKKNLQITAGG